MRHGYYKPFGLHALRPASRACTGARLWLRLQGGEVCLHMDTSTSTATRSWSAGKRAFHSTFGDSGSSTSSSPTSIPHGAADAKDDRYRGEPWPELLGVDVSFLTDGDDVATQLRVLLFSIIVSKNLRVQSHGENIYTTACWRRHGWMLAAGGAGQRHGSRKDSKLHYIRKNVRKLLQAAADVYGLKLPHLAQPQQSSACPRSKSAEYVPQPTKSRRVQNQVHNHGSRQHSSRVTARHEHHW